MKAVAAALRGDVGPPAKNPHFGERRILEGGPHEYVGIDWGTRRAAWCAFDEHGEMLEGTVSADQDGLARVVHAVGPEAYGCVELMSGAVWVREQLQA